MSTLYPESSISVGDALRQLSNQENRRLSSGWLSSGWLSSGWLSSGWLSSGWLSSKGSGITNQLINQLGRRVGASPRTLGWA